MGKIREAAQALVEQLEDVINPAAFGLTKGTLERLKKDCEILLEERSDQFAGNVIKFRQWFDVITQAAQSSKDASITELVASLQKLVETLSGELRKVTVPSMETAITFAMGMNFLSSLSQEGKFVLNAFDQCTIETASPELISAICEVGAYIKNKIHGDDPILFSTGCVTELGKRFDLTHSQLITTCLGESIRGRAIFLSNCPLDDRIKDALRHYGVNRWTGSPVDQELFVVLDDGIEEEDGFQVISHDDVGEEVHYSSTLRELSAPEIELIRQGILASENPTTDGVIAFPASVFDSEKAAREKLMASTDCQYLGILHKTAGILQEMLRSKLLHHLNDSFSLLPPTAQDVGACLNIEGNRIELFNGIVALLHGLAAINMQLAQQEMQKLTELKAAGDAADPNQVASLIRRLCTGVAIGSTYSAAAGGRMMLFARLGATGGDKPSAQQVQTHFGLG